MTRRKWKNSGLFTRASGGSALPARTFQDGVRIGLRLLAMDIIDVAAALLIREQRLLITQRPAGSHLEGLWEFPGGKREAGETFEQCLLRELEEELGIEVEVGPLVETLVHSYPEKTVCLKFFRCWLKNKEPRPLGCSDFRWVTASQLAQYQFPAADALLLRRLEYDQELWASS